jgi:hypothetical protein
MYIDNTQVEVFWFVAACSVVVGHLCLHVNPEDGSSMALRNVDTTTLHGVTTQKASQLQTSP